jgi:hypothetical protein
MITARVLFATAALATVTTVGPGCIRSYQQQSAGLTGCPPDEIQIEKNTMSTWRATCRGRTFWCSMGETAACTPELAPGEAAASDPVAAEPTAPAVETSEPAPEPEPAGDPTAPEPPSE